MKRIDVFHRKKNGYTSFSIEKIVYNWLSIDIISNTIFVYRKTCNNISDKNFFLQKISCIPFFYLNNLGY